jgi:hypothetical protein
VKHVFVELFVLEGAVYAAGKGLKVKVDGRAVFPVPIMSQNGDHIFSPVRGLVY